MLLLEKLGLPDSCPSASKGSAFHYSLHTAAMYQGLPQSCVLPVFHCRLPSSGDAQLHSPKPGNTSLLPITNSPSPSRTTLGTGLNNQTYKITFSLNVMISLPEMFFHSVLEVLTLATFYTAAGDVICSSCRHTHASFNLANTLKIAVRTQRSKHQRGLAKAITYPWACTPLDEAHVAVSSLLVVVS